MSYIYYPIVNDYGEEIDSYSTRIVICPNCKESFEISDEEACLDNCPCCGYKFC